MKKLVNILIGIVIGWWCTGFYYNSDSNKRRLASDYVKKIEKELEEERFINKILHSSFSETAAESASDKYSRDSIVWHVIYNYDNLSKKEMVDILLESLN